MRNYAAFLANAFTYEHLLGQSLVHLFRTLPSKGFEKRATASPLGGAEVIGSILLAERAESSRGCLLCDASGLLVFVLPPDSRRCGSVTQTGIHSSVLSGAC